MIHPHKYDHISILTDGTEKNVHVYAPNGDEIKGIISVELAPIKNDGLCEATIRCYLQPRLIWQVSSATLTTLGDLMKAQNRTEFIESDKTLVIVKS